MAMREGMTLVPLPIGERWLGAAETVRGILYSFVTPPHPPLRGTFSPMGRRKEAEAHYGHA